MSTTPTDAPRPRLCILRKWPDYNVYGFNLHADMGKVGQYVGSIDKNSPAEAGGLLSGDRIIEVNGINISNEYHVQVVERIKANPDKVRLLVISPEGEEYYKKMNVIISEDMENIDHCESPIQNPFRSPAIHLDDKYALRLCRIYQWKDFHGYGFNVQGLEGKPGHFVGSVDENSPAQLSGLKENDRILEVNHEDVTSKLHKEVVDLIRSGKSWVELLVVDPEAEKYLTKKGISLPSKLPFVLECKGPQTNPRAPPSISISDEVIENDTPVLSKHLRPDLDGGSAQSLDTVDSQQQRGVSPTPSEGASLQLANSAKEARERMVKKKNVKDIGLSIRDKFQILQRL